MAPGVALVGAPCAHQLVHHRRQDRRRVLAADQVDALERLVDEIQRVAAVGERSIGRRAQHEVGDRGEVLARDHREQGALGGIPVAHLDPLPKPAPERRQRRALAVQRLAIAARRLPGAVGADAPDALEQRQVTLVVRQLGQNVAQRGHDRHADAKAVTHAGAEQRRVTQQDRLVEAGGAGAEDRLRDHEAEAVRHAVVQAPPPVRGRVRLRVALRGNPDLAALDPDLGDRHVVGPQIEGAPARQVEAGVMPVAGEDAVPDAALVQREAEMRAAVVERPHLALVMDHQQRAAAAPDHQPPARLEILERPDVEKAVRSRVHCPIPFRQRLRRSPGAAERKPRILASKPSLPRSCPRPGQVCTQDPRRAPRARPGPHRSVRSFLPFPRLTVRGHYKPARLEEPAERPDTRSI